MAALTASREPAAGRWPKFAGTGDGSRPGDARAARCVLDETEVNVKAIYAGVAIMAGALFLGPPALEAQAPVVLVCQDGTTQPGSSKVACADHKGMDWDATKTWSEMRAGHFAESDSLVCTDGQRQAAARNACSRHGGVDSVSTMAAVRRRAKAERYAGEGRAEATADRARGDSTKWGYPVDRSPEEQNPPGYRGMERPSDLNTQLGDSAGMDSSAARSDSGTMPGSDSSDVIHRQRSVPPGTAAPPPPYPADSEKAWVRTRPQGDSVAVPDSAR